MFAHFELPDIGEVSRRTVATSLLFGVVVLVAAFSFGYLWVGVGACIGLALGTVNYRLVGVSVDKVAATGTDNPKRPLAANTLGRLAVVTVIALGLAFINKGLGFGVLGGLALFQFVLIFNMARSMAKAGPAPDDDGDDDDPLDGPIVDSNVVDVTVAAGRRAGGGASEGGVVDSNVVDVPPPAGTAGDDIPGGA